MPAFDTDKLLRENAAQLADSALAELQRRGIKLRGREPIELRRRLREQGHDLPPLELAEDKKSNI